METQCDVGDFKHSTTPNPWLVEDTDNPPDAMEYICIATDLLERMFTELRALAANNTGLARAMSSRESDLRDRLWTLHETVDVLASITDRSIDVALMRRATVLISWVSADIDELALCTAGDESELHAYPMGLH